MHSNMNTDKINCRMSFERQKLREELMLAHFKNEAQRTDVIPYELNLEKHPKQIKFIDIDNTCYILHNTRSIYTPNHLSPRPYRPHSYTYDSPNDSYAINRKSPSQLISESLFEPQQQQPLPEFIPSRSWSYQTGLQNNQIQYYNQQYHHHHHHHYQHQLPQINQYYESNIDNRNISTIEGYHIVQQQANNYFNYSDPSQQQHHHFLDQQSFNLQNQLHQELFDMPQENQQAAGAESSGSSESSTVTIMQQSNYNHGNAESTSSETTASIPPWPISSNSTMTMNNIVFNYDPDKPMTTQQPPECRNFLQQQRLNSKAGPKLIWLLFMHRHGDRTPLNMAPRDEYNNIKYWPEGFGNLINPGRLRMYKLGKFIRNRYQNFLTDNMREIYARSSDVDRCIESAQALLAGLYPPTSQTRWNPDLLWLPAPIHTVPGPDDYVLNESGRKYLQNYINELHIIQNSDAVKKLYQESAKERELLERELGYEFDTFTKFKCAYSTLDIEQRCGFDMPAWYTPQLKEKLYRYSGIAFSLAASGTEKLKKIRSGHLLEDIIDRMELASVHGPRIEEHSEYQIGTNMPGANNDKRVVHFSTHDSIISVILEALGLNGPMPVPPGFGSTFFIELYVDLDDDGIPTSEKYLRFYYMDDTESEKPVEKKLASTCETNSAGQVTLNNFRKFVSHLLPHSDQFIN